jgi:hypothetical protein
MMAGMPDAQSTLRVLERGTTNEVSMNCQWQIDGDTVVEAKFSHFSGREVVLVNGTEVHNKISWRVNGDIAFALPDGRPAVIAVRSLQPSAPVVLSVDGELQALTPKRPLTCAECGAELRANGRTCERCGRQQPSDAQRKLERARMMHVTSTMKALAVVYTFSGTWAFFRTRAQTVEALAKLDGLDANTLVPYGGEPATVSDLRARLLLAPWAGAITAICLVGFMVAFAIWGKREPLQAVLSAVAIYTVFAFREALVGEPRLLLPRLLWNILFYAYFARGIRSAIALRAGVPSH